MNTTMNKMIRSVMLCLATLLAVCGVSPAMAATFPATQVTFESASSALSPDAQAGMKAVASYLGEDKEAKVKLSGFVDSTGDPEKNKVLAHDRALAVRDALKAAGVAEDRIVLQKPEEIVAGKGDEARRVDITLYAASAAEAAGVGGIRARAQQGRRRLDDRRHRARHHDVGAGAGAVLRRPGAQQEHAVGADAGVRHLLDDRRALVPVRLQPGIHRGQRVRRRLRSRLHEGNVRRRDRNVRDGGDVQQGRLHPRAALPGVPGDVRGDHLLPDRRRLRRAHEVQRGAGVHGPLVHVQLLPDRPHGLVLDGPRCLRQQGGRRRDRGQGRPGVPVGRARLRRRHGRAHQLGGRGAGRRVHGRQAHRLRPRSVHAALGDADDGRCRAAVGRLVRLQRRLGARSRQHRGPRLHQHLLGDRRGGAGLVHRRGDLQGQGVDGRRRLGRRRRPGGDHPGLRQRRPDGRAGRSASSPASPACGASTA